MQSRLSRRRMIQISAATAGLALLPSGLGAAAPTSVEWQGRALGAVARLTINHPNPDHAHRLLERVEAEIRRLERIFSLYLPDSEMARLNRDGVIHAPAAELVELLETCRFYWESTGGVFDPTVQPLWQAYRRYFTSGEKNESLLATSAEAALKCVGFEGVAADRNRIVFAKPGMALTLNGIAQGYITDRIIDMLRAAGMDSCLADLGECRALGEAGDGGAWQVGIEDPRSPGGVAKVLEIRDRAVATSSPFGFRFEETGQFNHLINPRTGLSALCYASITVVAPSAAEADALSTAFSLMERDAIRPLLNALTGVEVHTIDFDGQTLDFSS